MTSWRIDRIQLKSIDEADQEQMYLVTQKSGQQDLSTLLKLSQQGLVYDFNVSKYLKPNKFTGVPETVLEGPVFTDLSVSRNIVMSIDTSYKSIRIDSTFRKVPVTKKQLIVKTIDEKAEEAAALILKIRKRRLNVITGKGEIPVNDFGIQRLDELVEEYLTLFLGKNIEEHRQFTFYFTPSAGEVFEHEELFEFSENRGIITQHLDDSEVISLTVRRQNEMEGLNNYGLGNQLPMQENALYYRVPDHAEVNISIGEDILIMERVSVYQYGAILSMPVSLVGK